MDWRVTFPNAEVQALLVIRSDHSPLLLVLHPDPICELCNSHQRPRSTYSFSEKELVAAVLWFVWKARNNAIFRAKTPKPNTIVDSVDGDRRREGR